MQQREFHNNTKAVDISEYRENGPDTASITARSLVPLLPFKRK
jgi:hypothetical protein